MPRRRSNSRSRAAHVYAQAGWHVFPVNGKQPMTPHGLKDATTDLSRVGRWWRTPHNIGVACGPSGLLVIDVDPDSGGTDTYLDLLRAGWDFPVTRTQLTPSGGFHLFYRMPAKPLSNTAGRLHGVPDPTPGIDIRGDGGYVVVAPSRRGLGSYYEWVKTYPVEMSPAPYWLSQTSKLKRTNGSTSVPDITDRYVETALHEELDAVRRAPQGTRNHQLNSSVFQMWRFVTDGKLAASTVRDLFTDAAIDSGLERREIEKTIASASQSRLAL